MKQINGQSQRFSPTTFIQAFGDLMNIIFILQPTVFVLSLLLLAEQWQVVIWLGNDMLKREAKHCHLFYWCGAILLICASPENGMW